jgi:hypothetical protein
MDLRRGFGRPIALAVSAILVVIATGSSASGTSQVGQTFSPTMTCGDTSTFVQATSPWDGYVVPFDGVLTAWSHEAGLFAASLKLKVARPQGGTAFEVIGESGVEAMTASSLNVFPTRIPVRAGDVIGFFDAVNGGCGRELAPGYILRFVASTDVPAGATADFPGAAENSQLDVAATLEADCDADGFGDETQDPALDCVAPDTAITSGPASKTRRRKATFEFSSDESGAALQCRLDGSPFQRCGSPFKLLKVKKGTHTFEVRARDAAGNVDQSPAALTWLVKKKKKKKKK